jgi:hypothetical protein
MYFAMSSMQKKYRNWQIEAISPYRQFSNEFLWMIYIYAVFLAMTTAKLWNTMLLLHKKDE